MRSFVVLLLFCSSYLIQGCLSSFKTPTNPAEVREQLDDSNLNIIKFETPDIIPNYRDEYVIRTRIVIQLLAGTTENAEPFSMLAAHGDSIINEFKNAEEVFCDLGLKFRVEQVSFIDYDPEFEMLLVDATKYPNHMSVYFLLPSTFPFAGMGMPPFYPLKDGIIMSYARDEWGLAHEIGHYFGLLHPFPEKDLKGNEIPELTGEDYCNDTPMQDQSMCYVLGSTKNCMNVMSYCAHSYKDKTPFVTDDQIDRMRKYLTEGRENVIIEQNDRTDPFVEELEAIVHSVFMAYNRAWKRF